MSTLDSGGNSNGEVPTFCWDLAAKYPQQPGETHAEWITRLLALHRSGIKS
jgi:hypothetical protein